MIAVIDRVTLKNALTTLRPATIHGARSMPVLGYVLIQVDENLLGVKLSVTDLEVSIVSKIPAAIAGEYSALVPFKELAGIVNKAKGKSITLEDLESKLKVITCAGTTILLTKPADEFPTLPIAICVEARLDAEKFMTAARKVFPAASQDETRYNLNGIYLENDGGDALGLVATDGHRMSKSTIVRCSLKHLSEYRKGLIVPRSWWKLFINLKGSRKHTAETLNLYSDVDPEFGGTPKLLGVVIYAKDMETKFIVKLIVGEYPNYRQVIPSNIETRLTIDRRELLEAIESIEPATPERSKAMKLSFSEGKLILASSNGDTSAEASVKTSGKCQEIEFGASARYVREAIEPWADEKVTLELVEIPEKVEGERDPVMLSPFQFTSEDGSSISVVMPMRL